MFVTPNLLRGRALCLLKGLALKVQCGILRSFFSQDDKKDALRMTTKSTPRMTIIHYSQHPAREGFEDNLFTRHCPQALFEVAHVHQHGAFAQVQLHGDLLG